MTGKNHARAEQLLTGELADAFRDGINAAEFPFYFGAEHLAQNKERERIIFVALGGPLEPVKRSNGEPVDGKRLTPCRTRVERCVAHIYGRDNGTTEFLFDSLVATMAVSFEDGISTIGYAWKTEESGESGKLLRSKKIEFQFDLKLPIVEEIASLRAVVGFETTETFSDPPQDSE